EVGHMVGIELPVLAMEHHYLITEDLPELAGREREIVNTTDYAGEIYMRQERHGALIGTYEPHGVVWAPVTTPDEFSMQLLPEDFERLAPYFEVGFQHFPALGRVGLRKAVNGPFTFAPDGNPLVGPGRGPRDYWVAGAGIGGVRPGGGIRVAVSRRPVGLALDGVEGAWSGHPLDGRRALRRVRDAEVCLAQGAGELRAALPPRLPERGAAGRAPSAPLADLRAAAGGRGRHGRELRARERALVCAAGHRARRDADLPPLRGLPGRARRVSRGAQRRRSLRDHQLRQVRGERPRRARLARPGVRLAPPGAGAHRARADAQRARPHRRRPVDRRARGRALPHRRFR